MSSRREFEHAGESLHVQLERAGEGRFRVSVGERHYEVEARRLPDGRVRFTLGDRTYDSAVSPVGGSAGKRGDLHVSLGESAHILVAPSKGRSRRGDGHGVPGDGTIVAPMTGTVLKIDVSVGDAVAAADTVAVVSAMKMEHKLSAGLDGTVAEILAADGDTVDQDQVLLRIAPE